LYNPRQINRTGTIATDARMAEIHESCFASWATNDGVKMSAVEITSVMNKKVNCSGEIWIFFFDNRLPPVHNKL